MSTRTTLQVSLTARQCAALLAAAELILDKSFGAGIEFNKENPGRAADLLGAHVALKRAARAQGGRS